MRSAPEAASIACLVSFVLAGLCAPACAQDLDSSIVPETDPPPETEAPVETDLGVEADLSLDPTEADPTWSWVVEVKPMIWVPGLRGDVELPRSSSVDVETINIDEVEATPAGRMSIRAGNWTFRFRGYAFSLDESDEARSSFTLGGGTVAAGDPVFSDLELAGFDVTAGYRLWTPVESVENETRLGFDLYGGVRVNSLDLDVTSNDLRSQEDYVWLQPLVGLEMQIDLPRGFGVEASFDVGVQPFGDETAFSWDATAAFQWRFARHAGLEIGFRHQQLLLEKGSGSNDFEFDASLAGLYGALVFRF